MKQSQTQPPPILTRQQTVIVAANEKDSTYEHESATSTPNGYYEVILNKPVVVANNDVVSIKSCFIDTTKIDVEQVNIPEDVTVTYTNGIYVRNQQLVTFFANRAVAVGDLLTDNKPYALCYIQPATGAAGVVHYTTATARSVDGIVMPFGGHPGDLHYQIQYQDGTGVILRTAAYIPLSPGGRLGPFPSPVSWDYAIDFIGINKETYWPRAVDPLKDVGGGNTVLPPNGSFPTIDAINLGWIHKPLDNIQSNVLENNICLPVLNRGSFIIPKGDYEPTHLAQIITDKFSTLPTQRERQSVIEPTAPFFLTLQLAQPANYPSGTGVTAWINPVDASINNFNEGEVVILTTSFTDLPYPYDIGTSGVMPIKSTGGPSQEYLGWYLNISYYSLNPTPGGDPVLNQNIRTIFSVGEITLNPADPQVFYPNRFVFGSVPDTANPISVRQFLSPQPMTSTGAGYISPTVILTPPPGKVDGGSCFLQCSLNYQAKIFGSGENAFCFADINEPTNPPTQILTFDVTGNHPQTFGTNEIALTYDTDIKKFKFDQIHYAATNGVTGQAGGSTPAIIKQTLTALGIEGTDSNWYPTRTFGTGTSAALPPVGLENESCVNVISNSIGGIFFTDIRSSPPGFFTDTLGFEITGPNSILATVGVNTTSQEYAGYEFEASSPPTNLQNGGQNTGAKPAIAYGNLSLPYISLVEGRNITAQTITIGDATGVELDYTGEVAYSESAGPTVGDGRVSVQDDAKISIVATGKGSAVGVQDSGYYIVDVEVGLQYNEYIGSDRRQEGFTRNIRMIVDRYYSANAYVSSEGDGINYIHYGNDMVINSVKVRIYNSDGAAIQRLGPDNSVFLRIMKTVEVNIAPLLEAQAEQQKLVAKEIAAQK